MFEEIIQQFKACLWLSAGGGGCDAVETYNLVESIPLIGETWY